jgi:Zn-dependent M28 family amino/carboxypeptidase
MIITMLTSRFLKVIAVCLFCLPTFGQANQTILQMHVNFLVTGPARSYENLDRLNFVAEYIFEDLKKHCDTVFYQEYTVQGVKYKNVIGSIGYKNKERIIVGAHYDVCGNQAGADDNASGVAGLLETARLMKGKDLGKRYDFVAFTLEEPPYFRSTNMGSYIHAKSLIDEKADVKGMVCLEMIGFYSSEENSQTYPMKFLRLFYGKKGDFITVVNRFSQGKFGRSFNRNMKDKSVIEVKRFLGPKALKGIDFSDHMNYWKMGIDAVMITDTSFYRNPNYHQKTDTIDTLDFKKMTQVVDGVCNALIAL